MALEIVHLKAEHLAGAAALFAERFRHARSREKLLPIRHENPKAVLTLINDLASKCPVVLALRAGRVVGILGGSILPSFRGRKAIYSKEWANGLAPGEGRETFWRMYEEICGQWVSEGCDLHLLTAIAADSGTLSALRWAGFFGMSVDAVRGFEPAAGKTTDLEIRLAKPQDLEEVFRLKDLHVRHMHAAPVYFSFATADPKAQYAEELADPARRIWLACISGRPIGYIGAGPIKHDAGFLLQDAKTAAITGAYMEREHRGKGMAAALLQTAVNWVRDTGYERLAVDFEPENTVASRFWCRHFRVVGLSFGRIINTKVA